MMKVYLHWNGFFGYGDQRFFLRACRLHIIKTDNLTLENNFITTNAYSCIENNAQNLIILIRKFRNNGLTEMFLPTLFNSQPCEENFRKLRSMGSMNYTKINFTMLELIHLVGRVELMNDIMFFKLADSDVYFPRNPTTRKSKNKFELPNDDEIRKTVSNALNTAVVDALKFGMCIKPEEVEDCKLKNFTINLEVENEDIYNEHIDLGIGSEQNILECENLRDYSNKNSESNSYINVSDKIGSKTVRKTGLIWNLTSSKRKLSADRLTRVRGMKKICCRQIEFVDASIIDQPISKLHEIKIGDWCVFEYSLEENQTQFILGNIISFQYSESNTFKEREYRWDFAPILQQDNSRNIGALSSWYKIDENGIIYPFKSAICTFIKTDYYIATLNFHTIERLDGGLLIKKEFLTSIQRFIAENMKQSLKL